MFKRKGGGGFKGLLNNVKKNCTFLTGRLPLQHSIKYQIYCTQVIIHKNYLAAAAWL